MRLYIAVQSARNASNWAKLLSTSTPLGLVPPDNLRYTLVRAIDTIILVVSPARVNGMIISSSL